MGAMELMSLDNPVFKAYLFYCSVLIIKMLLMAPLTARLRFAKKIFISPEDTKILKGAKSGVNDPDIERVRRAHLNDLENIPVFFVASYLYIMTNPAPVLAITLMRLFTIARIIHTIVYAVVVLPQPTRAIVFTGGHVITAYMAVNALLAFL